MAGRFDQPRGYGDKQKKSLPSEPPFVAYIGNLPNGIVQGDVQKIFENFEVKNIRLIKDRETDQFKGFCYVEFGTLEDLIAAIDLDGKIQIEGHSTYLRIDIADQRKNDKGGGFNKRVGNFGAGGGGGNRPGQNFKGGNRSGGGHGGGGFSDNFGGRNDYDRNRGGRSGYSDRGTNRARYGNFGEDNQRDDWSREPEGRNDGGGRGYDRGGNRDGGGGGGNFGGERFGNYNRNRGGQGGGGERNYDRRNDDTKSMGSGIDDDDRPRIVLNPRTVKDPINAFAETKQAATIFGNAKPRDEKTDGIEEAVAEKSS